MLGKFITTEDIVMVNLSEDNVYTMKKGTVLRRDKDLEILGDCLFSTNEGEKVYVNSGKVKKLSNSIKRL